jgi:hypothetical protein
LTGRLFLSDEKSSGPTRNCWTAKLKKVLPAHGNIFVVVTGLQKIQAETETNLHLLDQALVAPPRKRVRYRTLEERLTQLRNRLMAGELNPQEFAERAGRLIG